MIAVDTSALLAIALAEESGPACLEALGREEQLLISAGNVLECLIVARHKKVADEISDLLSKLDFQVVAVTNASARRAANAYGKWGKGVHPAGLNYGDCFAYEVATSHACGLLYIGEDFAKTDVRRVLTGKSQQPPA